VTSPKRGFVKLASFAFYSANPHNKAQKRAEYTVIF
jgi:hypothetical protein